MFDKPEVDAYREVAAPASLRAKVMAQAETAQPAVYRRPGYVVSILAAAACFVLVAFGLFLGKPASDAVVTIDGAPLTRQAMVITPDEHAPMSVSARTLPPVTVTLSVETEDEAAVTTSASAGQLTIYSPAGDLLTSGTDCTVTGCVLVEWSVALSPGASETLTIGGCEYTITLGDDGSYSICQTSGK